MLKIAKQINKMTTEELKQALVETNVPSQVYAILQEGAKRKATDVIKLAASDPLIIGSNQTSPIIIKYISHFYIIIPKIIFLSN